MNIKEKYNLKQIGIQNLVEGASQETIFKGIKCLKIGSPLYAQYEITKECNHRCTFCYNVWKRKKMDKNMPLTEKQQLEIVDKLAAMNIFGLIISGGEPLVSSNIFNVIKRAAKENKIETSIITNGSLLSDDTCRKLKESGLSDMQISLHSFKESDNDNMTNIKGSFNNAVLGIKTALKYFPPENININMVPTRSTYSQIFKTAKFLKNIGVTNFTVSSYVYTGNKKLDNLLAPSKDQFMEIYKQVKKIKKELAMGTFIGGCYPLCILGKECNEESISLIGNICDAGVTQIVVNPDGEIRPCVAYEHILGNILKDDPKEIWQNSEILNKIRKMENMPQTCRNCNHLVVCRGGCRASAYNQNKILDEEHPLLKNG